MIVDDAVTIVEKLTEILSGTVIPLLILHTGSFEETLPVLAQMQPDIVILDINLPGKHGIDVLKFLKIHYPGIKVIMNTNQSGDYYRGICRSMGCDCFLDKSFDFELLPPIIVQLYNNIK